MRKSLLLAAVAALASLSFGCAQTDYAANNAQSRRVGELNLGTEALGCGGVGVVNAGTSPGNPSSALAVTAAETLELEVRSYLLRPATLGAPAVGSSACFRAASFGPFGTALPFAGKDNAKNWFRENATYAFTTEVAVASIGSGFTDGTWMMAGAKSLNSDCEQDGFQDIRIATWFAPRVPPNLFTAFSCIGDGVDGLYGGPELHLLGDRVQGRQDLGGLAPETIALDGRVSVDFGGNVAAMTTRRATEGYSTYLGVLGRGGEGKYEFAKIRKADGLAEFFAGAPITVQLENGYSAVVSGALAQDGMITASVHQIGFGDSVVVPSTPITVSLSSDLKRIQYNMNGQRVAVGEIARWALENLPRDASGDFMAVSIGGFVPELGLEVPALNLQISAAGAQKFAGGSAAGTSVTERRTNSLRSVR